MPHIIPIKDLKNTGEISALCHRTSEPVFVTKNGYGDMVLMSMEAYEKTMYLQDVYANLEEAEHDIEEGRTLDARKLFLTENRLALTGSVLQKDKAIRTALKTALTVELLVLRCMAPLRDAVAGAYILAECAARMKPWKEECFE